MSTALLELRCAQVGLSMGDMDLLTIGSILDILTESANDSIEYPRIATQEDFDRF